MGTVVQAEVAHQGVGRRQSQSTGPIDRDFPAHIPRDRPAVESVEGRKCTAVFQRIEVGGGESAEGFSARGVVDEVPLPAVAPRAPAPAAGVVGEVGLVLGIHQFGVLAEEVEMSETGDVHHFRPVAIEGEGLVHIGQEVGGGADVVLQDDEGVVVGKHLCDAFDDVALEVEIFGTLHEGHALEPALGFGAIGKLVEPTAQVAHGLPRSLIASAVGEDVEVGVGR